MLESINNRLINASSALPRTKHLEKIIAAAVCLFIFFFSLLFATEWMDELVNESFTVQDSTIISCASNCTKWREIVGRPTRHFGRSLVRLRNGTRRLLLHHGHTSSVSIWWTIRSFNTCQSRDHAVCKIIRSFITFQSDCNFWPSAPPPPFRIGCAAK